LGTLNLRRFANAGALKTINVKYLIDLLKPYEEYLGGRGLRLSISSESDFNYKKLATILIEADENLPVDLVDAFFFIHGMSDANCSEKRRGRGMKVFLFDRGKEIWFLVRHGQPFQREGSLVKGHSRSIYYRPEKKELQIPIEGSEHEIEIRKASDIFRALAKRNARIPTGVHLVQASFDVKFDNVVDADTDCPSREHR